MKTTFLVLVTLAVLACGKEGVVEKQEGSCRQNGTYGGAICPPSPQPPPPQAPPTAPKESVVQLKAPPTKTAPISPQWAGGWRKVSEEKVAYEYEACWCHYDNDTRPSSKVVCRSTQGVFEKDCKVCDDHATCDGIGYAPTDEPLSEE